MSVRASRVSAAEFESLIARARALGYRGELDAHGGVLLSAEQRVSPSTAIVVAFLVNAFAGLFAYLVGGRGLLPLNVYVLDNGEHWLVAPSRSQLRSLGLPSRRIVRAPQHDIAGWFESQLRAE